MSRRRRIAQRYLDAFRGRPGLYAAGDPAHGKTNFQSFILGVGPEARIDRDGVWLEELEREPIRFLGEFSTLPVSCIPNAGLPLNVDGRAVYPMQPVPLAETLAEFVTGLGVNAVGGCCGTTPEHTRAIVAALGPDPRPAARPGRSGWFLSSGITATALRQDGMLALARLQLRIVDEALGAQDHGLRRTREQHGAAHVGHVELVDLRGGEFLEPVRAQARPAARRHSTWANFRRSNF